MLSCNDASKLLMTSAVSSFKQPAAVLVLCNSVSCDLLPLPGQALASSPQANAILPRGAHS